MNEDTWELEEKQALKAIQKHEAKKVLLQLPDGLKIHSKKILNYLEEKTDAEILVWAGSNYGACDIPVEAKNVGVDLIIHFGHSSWNYKREKIN